MSHVDVYIRGLQERFVYIANKIEGIQLKVDRRNPQTIDIAARELSDVIKDLQDLQAYQRSLPGTNKVDTDVRKSIGIEIDELLEVFYLHIIYFTLLLITKLIKINSL
jgi:hypothetical protein